jgi:Ca-activated chloride channel homolog
MFAESSDRPASLRSGPWRRATASAVVLVAALASRPPAAQVFHAGADALWVTATVVGKDGHLVTGLGENDFEVTDNGVPRGIVTFRHDLVPFALTIMLDVSGSMAGNVTTVRRAVAALVDRFEPGDRVKVGAFETVPTIGTGYSANATTIRRWTTDAVAGTLPICVGAWLDPGHGMDVRDRLIRHGGTSLWDGLACGIDAAARDAETPRRVVLVVTDGVDHVSATAPSDVLQRADTYGVMIYAVGLVGREGLQESELRAIAEQTGGGYFHLTSDDDVIDAFARIADELRHQYVFGVMPAGRMDGPHSLEVRAVKPGTMTRSRRVYVVAAPPAAPARAPDANPRQPARMRSTPEAPSTTPETAAITTAFERYARGEATGVPTARMAPGDLRRWSGRLRRAAELWIGNGPRADQARRRLVAATFTLQALSTQDDVRLWADQQPASDLIEWAGGLLREDPPGSAEQAWDRAAVAQLERFGALVEFDRLIRHEQRRFPHDERWVLAQGICAELATWPERRDGTTFRIEPTTAARVTARYTDAAALNSVREEALLRLGYFEMRRGQPDRALAHFTDVGEPRDPFLGYLLHLFQGRAFEQAHRLSDAIAAYRRAMTDVPFAQTATLELATALVEDHQAPEAKRLITEMLQVAAPVDPWTMYTLPDARFWSAAMRALQEAMRP